MLLYAMDQFAHVIIAFLFIFLPFFVSFFFLDDDIETISLSEVSRKGSNDFPDPQEVSYMILNSLQWPKPNSSLPFEGITSELEIGITKIINWEMLFWCTSKLSVLTLKIFMSLSKENLYFDFGAWRSTLCGRRASVMVSAPDFRSSGLGSRPG